MNKYNSLKENLISISNSSLLNNFSKKIIKNNIINKCDKSNYLPKYSRNIVTNYKKNS